MLEFSDRVRAPGWIAATLLCATSLMLPADRVAAEVRVGHVDRVVGDAFVASESTERPAHGGTRVRQGDQLRTAAGGRLVIVLEDGSRLHMGPQTRIALVGFLPEEGRRPGVIKIGLEGGAVRLQATSARQAPAKLVEVRHAAGTIVADNGVDLWCGPENGQLAVLVLAGRVKVSNWSGSVAVDRRRSGTIVSNLVTPPEPAYGWDRERIRRALASATGE